MYVRGLMRKGEEKFKKKKTKQKRSHAESSVGSTAMRSEYVRPVNPG
jgi:hypothetical protein